MDVAGVPATVFTSSRTVEVQTAKATEIRERFPSETAGIVLRICDAIYFFVRLYFLSPFFQTRARSTQRAPTARGIPSSIVDGAPPQTGA